MTYINKNKKRIKICIVSHFGYPLYNQKCKEHFGGGAEIQLFLLSKELMNFKNLDIHILTGNFNFNKHKIELYRNKIKLHNVLPIKRNLINYFRGLILFFFTLKKINPDIIIQRAASETTFLSALYCIFNKSRFIYSISSDSNVNGKDEKGLRGRAFLYGMNKAEYIIAQNYTQLNILRKDKKLKNVGLIRNLFNYNDKPSMEKTYILWVGRAVKLKRPELFIELAKLFPSEKFIMICMKKDDIRYWNYIRDEANKVSNLEFIEFIPFREINNYYEKAKIFLNTSTYEGFPNTFIQSFMNKTPVISLSSNPDNVFSKYRIGFCCYNDFNNLQKYLRLLIKNFDLYNEYSKNAFFYFKKFHNVNDIIKKWLNLLTYVYSNKRNKSKLED